MNQLPMHDEDKLAYKVGSWDLELRWTGVGELSSLTLSHLTRFNNSVSPGGDQYSSSREERRVNVGDRQSNARGHLLRRNRMRCFHQSALKSLMLGFQVKEPWGVLDWWKRDDHTTRADPARCESSNCGRSQGLSGAMSVFSSIAQHSF